ncbi:TetR/AcrR family transcriptional regulator [Photobacterium sanctipauli]|uniref:TetR/AcrR family transcriptional regulator n=1 Tax=Photobacterium sanctipauli TaxID=1342794 RepID=A0A2T3P1H1_9GAMM|nr:TetR/AcrR family transcriptional regulator [Photobacterium sanctipauli]PSW22318.1 TetR/AcrR family transcriptional regulator [Photobacterium sanctipauli]
MKDKKQLLTDTALTLFYEQGVNSVGINEVLKVSGVAKKTLYNHFASKEALVIATLEVRDAVFLNWLDRELSGAKTNRELIEALFNSLTAWFNDEVAELSPFRGCYFINTSAEYRDKASPVSHYCRQHKDSVRALIEQHMPVKNEALLTMICMLKEGAIVSAYTSHDLDAANKCIPLLLKLS